MREHVRAFWDWVDSRAVVRRIVLFTTLGLTVQVVFWAERFAELAVTAGKTGYDVPAIVAAVGVPVSWLVREVSLNYNNARPSIDDKGGKG